MIATHLSSTARHNAENPSAQRPTQLSAQKTRNPPIPPSCSQTSSNLICPHPSPNFIPTAWILPLRLLDLRRGVLKRQNSPSRRVLGGGGVGGGEDCPALPVWLHKLSHARDVRYSRRNVRINAPLSSTIMALIWALTSLLSLLT
jgi:hypothetical protein